MTPLFHSLGTEQLVESLAMQRLIAEQTAAWRAAAPVHVGPVTLRPRFNNVATAPQPAPTTTDLAEGYGAEFTGADDPRIGAPELRGVDDRERCGARHPRRREHRVLRGVGPARHPLARRQPRPVAEVLALAGRARAARPALGRQPRRTLWAIGARHERGTTVLAANIGPGDRELRVWTPAGEAALRLGSGEAGRVELQAPS